MRRLLLGLGVAGLMSACAPAVTLTVPPTFTIAPSVTPVPPATATLTLTPVVAPVGLAEPPTLTPAPPTAPPEPPTATSAPTFTPEPYDPQAGVNGVAFVADVTIPDRTRIGIGATFTKTWRLQNTGSLPWTTGYALARVRGDALLSAPEVAPLTQRVEPGAQAEVSVVFTAPMRPGTYRSEWQLRAPDGALFGVGRNQNETFYVEVVVVEAINGTPVPTPVGSRVPLVLESLSLSPPASPITAPCPYTLSLTGTVRATGVGRYTFRLETSAADPALVSALPGLMERYRQDTEPVSMPLTLTVTIPNTVNADFRLHAYTPRELFSAPVNVSLVCAP